jgi:thioredoxin-related protein
MQTLVFGRSTAVLAALALAGVTQAQMFSTPGKPAEGAPPAPAAPGTPALGPDGKMTTPGGITLPSGLYDEAANGQLQIQAAARLARAEHKRVLVVWGENFCEFCVRMSMLFKEDPRIKQTLEGEYVLQRVNIGKFAVNIDLASSYSTNLMQAGAPTLTVIDPNSMQAVGVLEGKSAVAQPMTVTRVFDEDTVFKFLFNNKAPARLAKSEFDAALARAKRDEKKLLVHFTAPTCGPCAPLGRALRDGPAGEALAKAFVVATIDTERMIAAAGVLKDLAGEGATLPVTVVVDPATGKPVEGGVFKDLGSTAENADAFEAALKTIAPGLSDAERAGVKAAVAAARGR